jgi:hypothetical protein
VAVVSFAVVALGATYVIDHYRLLHRGHTTALSVDEVRRRYEQAAGPTTAVPAPAAPGVATSVAPTEAATTSEATSTTASRPGSNAVLAAKELRAVLPRPGVYVYATHGGDSVDALSGDHHTYPATTTLTVTASGCGVVERWDVAKERWEESQRCIEGDAVRTGSFTTYDEFFGQNQTDAYTCSGDARPLDAARGATWATTCLEPGTTEVHHGTVVGVEPMQVGTVNVSTLHVRITIDSGQASDSQVTDSWFQAGTDFLVAQQTSNRTSNPSPVGAVTYHEDYEIHLTSFEPLT